MLADMGVCGVRRFRGEVRSAPDFCTVHVVRNIHSTSLFVARGFLALAPIRRLGRGGRAMPFAG